MAERIYQLRRALEDTPGEIDGYKLAALPSPWDPRDYRYENLLIAAGPVDIPRKTNYRANLPPVFDQGKFGTCVASSIASGQKAFQEISQGDYPSEGLSAAYLYAMCKQLDGIPNQAGTYPRIAFKVLQQYGICQESLYPYSTLTSDINVTAPPTTLLKAAQAYRIDTYAQLASPTDKALEARIDIIRQAIAREGPIHAAVIVTESFLDVKGEGIIPDPEGRWLGGHMICLADMDDDKQAFLVRNTWPRWGNGGYAWMPYKWLTLQTDITGNGNYVPFFMEAWTSTDIVVPRPASKIEITPGSNSMLVDGQAIKLDQPAFVAQDTNRLMLPLRAVAGNMGYIVTWTGEKAVLTKPN